jgi:hypothetical protein
MSPKRHNNTLLSEIFTTDPERSATVLRVKSWFRTEFVIAFDESGIHA